MFPRARDLHKPNQPLVPNGLGVIYVLGSTVYIFLVYFLNPAEGSSGVSPSLTLAACILFGGFMGLMDDWMDLKWRYKAFLPVIAAIPLMALAFRLQLRPSIALPLIGTINFGLAYYFIIIPVLVMIVANTVNQLGGLNGLETIPPAIILLGLTAISGSNAVLMVIPLVVWIILAFFNVRGRIFVGNTGSFAIGITLVAFSVISDLKFMLFVSVLPYIFNSSLILLTFFLFRTKGSMTVQDGKLISTHRRSLVTLLTHKRSFSEMQLVAIISIIVAAFAFLALVIRLAAP